MKRAAIAGVAIALGVLELVLGVLSRPSAAQEPSVAVRMSAQQVGKIITYTITVANNTAADIGDIFVAGTVPAGASSVRAVSTPPGSWFRGVEAPGTPLQAAVWLSLRVPAKGELGPYSYEVEATDAAAPAHAWVHWRLAAEGTAVSGPATLALPATPVAAFVGSQTCKSCHVGNYDSWRNTLHANMIRPAGKGDLSNARADLSQPGAPKPDQYDWAFVIGGWYKEERYAYRDAAGTIKTGEFEYNAPKKQFTLRRDRAGNLESLDWINECGACHTTGMNPNTRQWSEVNIACEACHGPGADHAKNPAAVRMAVDTSSEACGKCHIRGRDKSGQVNYPVGYEYGKPTTLMANFNPIPMTDAASVFPDQKNSSRHRQQFLDWSKSGHENWKVECVTCHDPHKGALTQRKVDLRASGDQLCAKCHSKQVSDAVAHSAHTSSMASCAACHMPKLIGSGSVSTHTFEAIPPAKTLQLGEAMANSCTSTCHKDRSVQLADEQFKRIFKR